MDPTSCTTHTGDHSTCPYCGPANDIDPIHLEECPQYFLYETRQCQCAELKREQAFNALIHDLFNVEINYV